MQVSPIPRQIAVALSYHEPVIQSVGVLARVNSFYRGAISMHQVYDTVERTMPEYALPNHHALQAHDPRDHVVVLRPREDDIWNLTLWAAFNNVYAYPYFDDSLLSRYTADHITDQILQRFCAPRQWSQIHAAYTADTADSGRISRVSILEFWARHLHLLHKN
ncbi:MAG: hypothetical protein ACOCWQ_06200 [Nanoarchaeota archaeon]